MIITKHAEKQAKARFSLSRKALARIAERAFMEGERPQDARKNKRSALVSAGDEGTNKIYKGKLFVFSGDALITVLQADTQVDFKRFYR